MVEEKPFIMLAGEVRNSSSSCLEYMGGVWDKAEALGLNSLLLPITWELLEPVEGEVDYSLVDGLILQARDRGMRIGFLWFGAWKNAQCYYAPSWVKKDLIRFKRAQMEKGKNHILLKDFHNMPYTSLSYLCEATCHADANAFKAFMKRIKEIDEDYQTVIAVQVENETGVMGAARENSDEADALFNAEVPQEFINYLRDNTSEMAADVKDAIIKGASCGSWNDVFGCAAEEIFSAYCIASYVNNVAKAGKSEYALPMIANCWLDKGDKAGIYPSGGPVARMMEVWQYCAPSIDIIAPDIYVQQFCDVCDEYKKLGNPLFIPETATHSYAAPRMVYVVGHHHAICYAPFAFEEMGEPFSSMMGYLFGIDTEDPMIKTPQNTEEYNWFAKALASMLPLFTEKFGTQDLQAVSSERVKDDTMVFGDFGIKAIMEIPTLSRKDGCCLVLKEAEDTFFILTCGCYIKPFSTKADKPNVDIISLEEGVLENGSWKKGRRLNGDEVAITLYEKPTLLKMQLFAYS
jgi:hypothetical protein